MDASAIHSLLQPEAYPETTSQVRLVQTHISLLFITDSYVYKVKKPVDLGFLNFTTLDRRRFYCNEEVRLNSRLCPRIYLGVAEVRESGTGPSFTGGGTIIDYAVKMKRLPEEKMLNRLVSENRVGDEEIRQVAQTVAQFHLKADSNAAIAAYGTVAAIRNNWEENFRQLATFEEITFRPELMTMLRQWVERFLETENELITLRVEEGFIRDCDGDLHLDNICLTDEVCIFDCIEFNERFRFSDTAADIAFLLMDLDFHGASGLGDLFLEEYVNVTGDDGVIRLLPFYKTYRAVVRAKVESFRLNDSAIPAAEKASAREKAIAYFSLARRYVLGSYFPRTLIIMCGLMGSGKSTLAAALARETGISVESSDRIRKELSAVSPEARCYDDYGKGMYAPEADITTYAALRDKAQEALSDGRSIIIDASFRRRIDRDSFRSLAARHGARFVILLTRCTDEEARIRLEARVQAGISVSDGRWDLYKRQKSEFQAPSDNEGNHIFIDTSHDIDATIDTILVKMGALG